MYHVTEITKKTHKHKSRLISLQQHTVRQKCQYVPLPILQNTEMPTTAVNTGNSLKAYYQAIVIKELNLF